MESRRTSRLVVMAAGLFWFFAWPAAGLAATASESANDVRVLIDISGSMKRNDPNNLRAPALRLLTGLLPNGARAGVWIYGQQVNMLVPHGTVDARWKDHAQQAAAKIGSTGLFTNIEDALLKAGQDWRSADPAAQRSLIMLTDGLVDISKDPALNTASRDRIVNEILPRLRDAGVKIHTIALSKDADHALLRQLAAASDGWYEKVDNADDLQRVFLRMFEKATKPDTLPIKDNTVQVDASIEEMTLLVFREPGKSIELLTPADKIHSAAAPPASARWYSDTGYDLITLSKPEPGAWRIRGTQDSDNRVMVVTNLKVRATGLPNNLSIDAAPYYFVQLTQDGTVINQQKFLELVKISLRRQDPQGKQIESPLLDDGQAPDISAGDGTFSYRFGNTMNEGRHELVLLVDGTTFKREQRQVINVYSQPAAAGVSPHPAGGGRYVLTVIPHAGLIDTQTMQVTAVVTGPDGNTAETALAQNGPAEWRREITVDDGAGRSRVEFTVQGMRPDGKPITEKLDMISFGADGVEVVPPPAAPVAEPAAEPAAEAPPAAETVTADGHAEPAAETQPAEPVDWFAVAWQTLLINAVLIAVGFFAYKRWRRTQRPPAVSLEATEP